MFYKVLRWLVRIILEIYFRKIYIHGLEKIPNDKPLLLASNHPSAFLEACILACYIKRPLHFLVRGDVFVAKFLWFFKATNQVPIYRFRDGYNSLKKNASTFQYCYDTLANGKIILVFPEGNTELEKRLRPIQKGTARIAFGTMEAHGDIGLTILPVGVNYTHPLSFKKDVMVSFGEPLQMESYFEAYKIEKNKAINALTKDIEKALFEKVVHVEASEEETLEQLFELSRGKESSPFYPVVQRTNKKLNKEKALADRYLELDENSRSKLRQKIAFYFEKLANENIADHHLFNKPNSTAALFGKSLVLLLGFPLALVGFILNGIPAFVANFVAKSKVKLMEFFAPVRIGVALLMYIILFLVIIILAIFNKLFWLLFLAIPVFGYFSLWYLEVYSKWKADRARLGISENKRMELLKIRKEIAIEFPYI
jgi:1-acyl-sn-glycerol-3-phosphate acyltransferase